MRFAQDTLYVTDLDGTLLGSDAKIPAKALEMLNEMLDAGLPFTVATARSWSSAAPLLKDLHLKHPAVAYNGAFLMDPGTGTALDRCLLDRKTMENVAEVFLSAGLSPMVYAQIHGEQKVSWLKEKEHAGIVRYAKSRRGDPRLNPVCTVEELFLGDVFYFSALGAQKVLSPLAGPLREMEGIHVNFMDDAYDPSEFWLEVSRSDATKAVGVDKLRRLTGIPRIVCFGDNLNDLPMFRVADEGYAVQNAKRELKDAATGIIAANTQLGVPLFLRTRAL